MFPVGDSFLATVALLLLGAVCAATSGLLLAFAAKRVRMRIEHPVMSSLLSYGFACLVSVIGTLTLLVLVVRTGDAMPIVALLFLGCLYCLPILAVIFNFRLLRSAAQVGDKPLRLSRVAALVLSTQGVLFVIPVAGLCALRSM